MSKNEASINILKKVVVDGLLLIILLLCIIASSMLWTPFQRGFFCDDESLKYPYNTDTVTVLALRLMILIPIFTFLICEVAALRRIRDNEVCLGIRIPAWVRGFYCVLVSFLFGACFTELATNITKAVIGRPRPHFFEVCVPSIDCSAPEWHLRYVQPHEYHCTGPLSDRYVEARKSFLSGHSSWAAFTMVYTALYLGRRMTWGNSRGLRNTLQFIVVMLSLFTALSRVSDYKHHWSDVLAGYVLGTGFAVLSFVYGTDMVPVKKDSSPLPQCESHITTIHAEHTELNHRHA